MSVNVSGLPNRPHRYVDRTIPHTVALTPGDAHKVEAGWDGGRRRRPEPEAQVLDDGPSDLLDCSACISCPPHQGGPHRAATSKAAA